MRLFFILVMCNLSSIAQNYTSYLTGNNTDILTTPNGGICLMGGATENDNAMTWFLQQANGGDVLVLRASGSDGYNSYFYSDLGVNVNSVETIVFNSALASTETYIHEKIQQAEAIWIAGGDQWDYVSFWRNTAIEDEINSAISDRNVVIGGTSAGMAILGDYYFSAENGTVTSSTALANPYDSNITIDSEEFISHTLLDDVITDTHYDNPDRKGRHLVFLSRIITDYMVSPKGIACDEYTAVCIDSAGIASVFGDYPNYDDNAYFIQTNCEVQNNIPENCSENTPLNWDLENQAIKVYKVKGTSLGSNTFNLTTWNSGTGGEWENWYVEDGVLNQISSTLPECTALSVDNYNNEQSVMIYPNPANDLVTIASNNKGSIPDQIEIYNVQGQQEYKFSNCNSPIFSIATSSFANGLYFIVLKSKSSEKQIIKLIVAH
ncbi:MAG: cyanophycinase [Bacteroidetes bacterium MedPE-SWsnd-G2]|nr:MAG: cyanophycinase [Bacteroidetes bacterium MedPE-SWsnd-G2]